MSRKKTQALPPYYPKSNPNHHARIRACAKAACCCLLLMLPLLSACTKKTQPITKHGFYFDTVIQITLYDDRKEALIDDCFALAAAFEQRISKTVPGSDIDTLNHAGGAPVSVSDDTRALLTTGLTYCIQSGGAFDLTIGTLVDLWDIKNNPGTLPTQDALAEALAGVGYQNIQISDNQVSLKNPSTQVDLGAIAKGYIADRMKAYLNEQGVVEGFINLGGNVLLLGPKQNGEPYTIGIQKPFSPEGTPLFSVELADGSVVSSGIYERYFEKDGRIYHHILDPVSGYPYDNGLLSVTIFCPASVDGDALSTTCFALGSEEGLKLVEATDHTEAVFVTKDYELITSSGMGEKIPYKLIETEEP